MTPAFRMAIPNAELRERRLWRRFWLLLIISLALIAAGCKDDAGAQSHKDGGAINAGSGNGADRKPGLPHLATSAPYMDCQRLLKGGVFLRWQVAQCPDRGEWVIDCGYEERGGLRL